MSLGLGRSLPVRGENTAPQQPRVLFAGAGRRRALQQQPGVENFNGTTSIPGPTSVRHGGWGAARCSAAAFPRTHSRLPFAVAGPRQPQQQQAIVGHLTPQRPCRANSFDIETSTTTLR